jgi:tyrosyl-tRNA synthetase
MDDLRARGLIFQNSPGIDEEFAKGTTVYLGFDPTGPDLHIGHLLGLTLLRRMHAASNRIIFLVGGGTSMIGDPGGKDAERPIVPRETIEYNKSKMKEVISRFLTFDDDTVRMVDNADWLESVQLISFLRDAGKYISVNSMLDKDSVATRIQREEGISYAEFSYQLLQAYDFLKLYQEHGCRVQIGGSDQWGNIIQGVELIRKRIQKPAFAMSYPLIVNPKTGKKFGKTESGVGIWLNGEKTPPFSFYQFLLNTDDDMAPMLMKFLSFRPVEEIDHMIAQWSEAKHERLLQRELAREITGIVHGAETVARIEKGLDLFFTSDPFTVSEWTPDMISLAEEVVPARGSLPAEQFDAIDANLISATVAVGLATSNGEARRLIQQNGITFQKLSDSRILIRKGKKDYGLLGRS